MAINKVIYGGETLIDLTNDTVTADQLKSGILAHDKSGAVITGTCTHDADTQDATAAAAEILKDKIAYVRGAKVTGTMPNKGAVTGTIATKEATYTIPMGFHDGSGSVGIDTTEQAKLIPGNIKMGVEVLGITGTLEPSSDVTAQAKSATPATTQQVVVPDEGVDYLSQVTIAAIPYEETENSAGGTTVTIAGVA